MLRWSLVVMLGAGCANGAKDADVDVDPDGESDTEQPTGDTETDTVETDEPVGPDLGVPYTLQQSGPVVCADPNARGERPLDLIQARVQQLREGEYSICGGSIGMLDVTGDGLLDIFLPGMREVHLHIQQPNGIFVDEAPTRIGRIDLSDASSIGAADVDEDGDLDLLVTRWRKSHVLLINNGTGYFTDGTAAAGLGGTSSRPQVAVFGDMDRDGDLDLFVGNYGPKPDDAFVTPEMLEMGDPKELYENVGGGVFVDVSERLPAILQITHTFMAGFHDADNDGWEDLLVINDFGWSRPSRILWNRATGLEMDDGSAGFDIPFAGMGLGVGDVNADGLPDFVQTSWKENSLLVSSPSGLWFDVVQSVGLTPDWAGPKKQIFGWGAEMGDLDNDGDHDIVLNFGWWDEYGPNRQQVDAMYLQDNNGNFIDQSTVWGLAQPQVSRGLVFADVNNDGWLDVGKRLLGDNTKVFLSRCGTAAWLKVKLRAPAPNTFGIGARVEVKVAGETQWRQVHAGGSGMYSAYEPEVHFGLGNATVIDEVRVRWPDTTWSYAYNIEPRQTLTFTRTP